MLATVFTKTFNDRWRGMAIAVGSLIVGLLLAMWVYSGFEASMFNDLPEVFRSLMNIPENADAAAMSVSVFYGFYGALTLAGMAIAMGAASIAGEERAGTFGLLLGNPKSRTHVLVAKAASMVALSALAIVVLWGAAYIVAAVLGVDLGGLNVVAYAVHLFLNTLFYGMLALALSAWTGSRSLAIGVPTGLMIVGFIGVGIFPLIEGWENVGKVLPWHYLDGSHPMTNGVSIGHLLVLLGASILLGATALLGINRRDLRSQAVGTTLLDRLRESPMTRKIVDRLAGSMRVSHIWIKTVSEHQGLLIVTAYVMFLIMGVMMGPLYALMDTALFQYADQLPEELWAFVGSAGSGMSTPEGFYEVETFGMTLPAAVMVVAIVIGSRGLAGEEANRTMGLLLANPIKRRTVVLEKTYAMIALAFMVGIATWTGVWIGSMLGGLGLNPANIAAASLLGTMVGLVFGSLALLLSAVTGRTRVAVFGTIGIALAMFLINSISILNDAVESIASFTPFDYYLSNEPLTNGMAWDNLAILTVSFVVLVTAAVFSFDRRDLRQSN